MQPKWAASSEMILRTVHMTFQPESVSAFLALFERHRDDIAGQPGCHSVLLIQDPGAPHRMGTVSVWEGEEALNAYRHSDLFGEVWPATKALFAEPPVAKTHSLLWAT